MTTSTFKLWSGAGAAEVVHIGATNAKALSAAVTSERLTATAQKLHSNGGSDTTV